MLHARSRDRIRKNGKISGFGARAEAEGLDCRAGRPALYEAKIEELRAGFALKAAVGVEARAPDFRLPDVRGNPVSLTDLLGRGPIVLTFYRGGWCPYCNIQLRAYQAVLPQIAALGARLVAISPQLPEQSLATAQTDELTFDGLSDVAIIRPVVSASCTRYAINRHVNETNR